MYITHADASKCHAYEHSINLHMLKVIFVTFVLKRGGVKLPSGVSPFLDQLEAKLQRIPPMFSGSNVSMVISVTLPDK